jgi:ergothioneine biosynthesis protein EgtB
MPTNQHRLTINICELKRLNILNTVAQSIISETKSASAAFSICRSQTLSLIQGISSEDCALQSMPDASPTKWHLAHTTWFFEVFVLERFEKNFSPFDEAFRVLFNSYYNGVGDKFPRAKRGLISRPDLSRVLAYRENVESRIHALLLQHSHLNAQQRTEFSSLIELGINHEQQHQELLLTDLKHLLSQNPLKPTYREGWPLVAAKSAPARWIDFEAGLHEIGNSGESFCFDNETPRHKVYINPFSLSSLPISHGDVLDFIADGGYKTPQLWLSMGWDTVQTQAWNAPLYWEQHTGDTQGKNNGWNTFTLRGMSDISRRVPCPHLSYFEADAIARWMGARLPRESEWELAATLNPSAKQNMLEDKIYHPLELKEGLEANQFGHLIGDVWEWTQSAYLAYPSFREAPGLVGEYNGKFMCNQFVLRGGSCVTPTSHIRTSYRNFFAPDARWQFSGARLAKDI